MHERKFTEHPSPPITELGITNMSKLRRITCVSVTNFHITKGTDFLLFEPHYTIQAALRLPRPWPNVDPMLAHRVRRWANNNQALDQLLVFAGQFLTNGEEGIPKGRVTVNLIWSMVLWGSPQAVRSFTKYCGNVLDVSPILGQPWMIVTVLICREGRFLPIV